MLLKSLEEKYNGKMELVIYKVGKDFGYLKKYGVVTKGTLILNRKKKFDKLSRTAIEDLIEGEIRSI